LGVTPPAEPAPASPPVEQGPTAPAPTQAPTPAAETSAVAPTNRQAVVGEAAQLIKQGADAGTIAKKLLASGIPPEQWPQDVQLAVSNAQLGVSR
jgi:hypothetical protein